ncbi:MAG: hypothetical protein AAF750_06140 [Planctomycetota bacterium]
MSWSESRTGYDAGNAGLLFCCTLPTLPVIGLAAGFALGLKLDNNTNNDA